MSPELEDQLDALRPGDEVTVVDLTGARFRGVVVQSRPEDPERSVGLRRSTGTVQWVPYERVRGLET